MRKPARSRRYAAAMRSGRPADDAGRELALLEEFSRCDSVDSLAVAIAARLGRRARSDDLIAEAGLPARRRDS